MTPDFIFGFLVGGAIATITTNALWYFLANRKLKVLDRMLKAYEKRFER